MAVTRSYFFGIIDHLFLVGDNLLFGRLFLSGLCHAYLHLFGFVPREKVISDWNAILVHQKAHFPGAEFFGVFVDPFLQVQMVLGNDIQCMISVYYGISLYKSICKEYRSLR